MWRPEVDVGCLLLLTTGETKSLQWMWSLTTWWDFLARKLWEICLILLLHAAITDAQPLFLGAYWVPEIRSLWLFCRYLTHWAISLARLCHCSPLYYILCCLSSLKWIPGWSPLWQEFTHIKIPWQTEKMFVACFVSSLSFTIFSYIIFDKENLPAFYLCGSFIISGHAWTPVKRQGSFFFQWDHFCSLC